MQNSPLPYLYPSVDPIVTMQVPGTIILEQYPFLINLQQRHIDTTKASISGSFALFAFLTLVMKEVPTWKPNDVDYFISSDIDYSSEIAYVTTNIKPTPIFQRYVNNKHISITDFLFHDDMNIKLSIIQVNQVNVLDIGDNFDITICNVSMYINNNQIHFTLRKSVFEHITNHIFEYAVTRHYCHTIERVVKYMDRGFVLLSPQPVFIRPSDTYEAYEYIKIMKQNNKKKY